MTLTWYFRKRKNFIPNSFLCSLDPQYEYLHCNYPLNLINLMKSSLLLIESHCVCLIEIFVDFSTIFSKKSINRWNLVPTKVVYSANCCFQTFHHSCVNFRQLSLSLPVSVTRCWCSQKNICEEIKIFPKLKNWNFFLPNLSLHKNVITILFLSKTILPKLFIEFKMTYCCYFR